MLYDKDIREPLFDYLEEYYGKVRVLEEKRIGKSRADVVMVRENCICGIEIKSDADSYARLASQIEDYNQYYDYNYVVVGSSHGLHIEEHVPDWWGILTVEELDGGVDFYWLRQAKENPLVDWKKKMSILWRPELVHIQELNQLPRYKQLSKANVIEKIIEKVDKTLLQQQISEELFERDYHAIAEQIEAYRKAEGKAVTRGKRRRRKKRTTK